MVDYSKWDDLDVSDDEEREGACAGELAKMRERVTKQNEVDRVAKADTAELNAAMDAAAFASSTGNAEMLGAIMAQAKAQAPLAPEMEALLSTLPEAARIAARASATASATASAMAGGAGAGTEPTLAELLRRQNISIEGAADDPGLEDLHEFIIADDEARESQLHNAAMNAADAAVMAATPHASTHSFAPPNTPKQLDSGRIEEVS